MMKLDEAEVCRLQTADLHGATSTKQQIEQRVARAQVVKALDRLACNVFSDPHVEQLVDILRFAFDHNL